MDFLVSNAYWGNKMYTVYKIQVLANCAKNNEDEHVVGWLNPIVQNNQWDVKKKIANWVHYLHTYDQDARILSIFIKEDYNGYLQIKWSNNPKVIEIPNMKQRGSYKQPDDSGKKRRTVQFHFENIPMTRSAIVNFKLQNTNTHEECKEESMEMKVSLGQKIEEYMITTYSALEVEDSQFENSGEVQFEIEGEETRDITIPSFEFTWGVEKQNVVFDTVEWATLI